MTGWYPIRIRRRKLVDEREGRGLREAISTAKVMARQSSRSLPATRPHFQFCQRRFRPSEARVTSLLRV